MKRIAAAAVLSLAAVSAHAADYVVGVEAVDYYPHYRSAGNEYSGFARDLLDAFAEDAGHRFSYRALPVNRLYQELIAGGVDFKYPDNAFWGKDAKGDARISYSAPVTAYVDGLMVLPAKLGGEVNSVGVVMGFTAFPYLDDIASGKRSLAERTSMDQLLNGVLMGRIDGAYVNVDVAKYQLGKMGKVDALVFAEALPADRGHYHLSTAKQAEVLKQFDAWLAANPQKLTELRSKHGLGD